MKIILISLIEYDFSDSEKIETQLLNLNVDPHETRHFPRKNSSGETWGKLEKALDKWFPESHRRVLVK